MRHGRREPRRDGRRERDGEAHGRGRGPADLALRRRGERRRRRRGALRPRGEPERVGPALPPRAPPRVARVPPAGGAPGGAAREGARVLPTATMRRRPLGRRLRRPPLPVAGLGGCVVRHGPARRRPRRAPAAGHGPLLREPPADRRGLGHARRVAVDHVRQRADLRGFTASRRARRRAGLRRGPQTHPGAGRRVLHVVVGQVRAVPFRRHGLGGPRVRAAGDVAAALLVPLPPLPHVVPRAHGLPAHGLPLGQAVDLRERRLGPGRARAARRALPGVAGLRCHPLARDAVLGRAHGRLLARAPAHGRGAAVPESLRGPRRPAPALRAPQRPGVQRRLLPGRGPPDELRLHRPREQGLQHARRLRRPARRRRRGARAPRAPRARLPLGRRGRHEDAGLQRQPVLGRVLRDAGHRGVRFGRRRAVPRLREKGLVLPRADPDPLHGNLPGVAGLRLRKAGITGEVLPPRVQGRLALLDVGARLAHLRLHGRGPQERARAQVPRVRRRVQTHRLRAALRRRGRRPRAAERRRRLRDVREHAGLRLVRVAQPVRGLRGHHDRLLLRGVLHGVERRARALHRGVPGPPRGGDIRGAEARQRVPAVHPARRRLLVRLLGLLLHLRGLVRHRGFSGFGRGPEDVGARRARVRVPPAPPAAQRRLGRGLHVLLRQGLREERHGGLRRRGGRGRRLHGLGAPRPHGGRVRGRRRRRAGRRLPRGAPAPGRRLAPGGHLRRLQPVLRHHLHGLPQRLPHVGPRALQERLRPRHGLRVHQLGA
mmetsp:Transcript_3452/g.11981  ORF Transcript_3452/g.11981 Transcript_3452/m.11981 type:complete len:772 (+) Transcript_3452:656-2971(+)